MFGVGRAWGTWLWGDRAGVQTGEKGRTCFRSSWLRGGLGGPSDETFEGDASVLNTDSILGEQHVTDTVIVLGGSRSPSTTRPWGEPPSSAQTAFRMVFTKLPKMISMSL